MYYGIRVVPFKYFKFIFDSIIKKQVLSDILVVRTTE